MRSQRIVHIVSCHAEGEVGDVIVGGVAAPPGATLWEQSRWIARDQDLRNFVLNEPRGGVFRHANLLVPAKDPRAQMGWIIMEPADTPPMSGSNSLCVATVLLDSGILPMREPLTRLLLEAPGGLIEARAECRDGKAERVEIRNVPSFADRLDAWIEVEGLGSLQVDTAYGGDSFVIADARRLGFALRADEAAELVATGEDHPRGQRTTGLPPPDQPGLGPSVLLPAGRAAGAPRRCPRREQRGGHPPRQDRPLALRHRLLGADGGAPGERPAAGRRTLRRALHHRFGILLPHRVADRTRRPSGDPPVPVRAGLDHRHPPVPARPGRSLAARLSAVRHLARRPLLTTRPTAGSGRAETDPARTGSPTTANAAVAL